MTRLVRLTTFSWPSALLAAQHRGFLEEAGIVLEADAAEGSRPQMEGLLAGRWDIAHTNADNIMKYRAAGHLDLFVVFVLEMGIAQKLVVRPRIADWADLRGGAVGVDAPDSGYAFVLYELLRRQGVPPGEYRIVPVGSTSHRLQALRAGEIDAGLLSQHRVLTALDEGFRVLADTHRDFADHPGVTAATTRGWADRNPDVLHGYTAALFAAAAWAHDPENDEQVVELIAEVRGIDADRARRVLDIEKAGRAGTVSSVRDVERGLAMTAALRGQFSGSRPTGYFDPTVLSAVLAGSAAPW